MRIKKAGFKSSFFVSIPYQNLCPVTEFVEQKAPQTIPFVFLILFISLGMATLKCGTHEWLKQLKLLGAGVLLARFCTVKELHGAKLLVGDAKDAHLARWRQNCLDAANVHIGIFLARAVPQVA